MADEPLADALPMTAEGASLQDVARAQARLGQQLEALNSALKRLGGQLADARGAWRGELVRLRKENEDLRQQRDELLQECDELDQGLRQHMERLATSDPEAFTCISADAGPQHPRLVQSFRRLKQQHLQALALLLFERIDVPQKQSANRPFRVAEYQSILTREVLVPAANRLRERHKETGAVDEQDLTLLARSLNDAARNALKIRDELACSTELLEALELATGQVLLLARDMALAAPPAKFLVPARNTRFDPKQHQSLNSPRADAVVGFTVFPGYVVPAQKRLLELVVVWTYPGKGN
ncbi:MAG: hypothetical protein L0Z62_26610 [Gemmataceae bacterium]|nr:hypothetical protein [Gemmataceae bacterium]